MPSTSGRSNRTIDSRQSDHFRKAKQGVIETPQISNSIVTGLQGAVGTVMLLSAVVLVVSALWVAGGEPLSQRIKEPNGVLPVVELGYTLQQATSYNVCTCS